MRRARRGLFANQPFPSARLQENASNNPTTVDAASGAQAPCRLNGPRRGRWVVQVGRQDRGGAAAAPAELRVVLLEEELFCLFGPRVVRTELLANVWVLLGEFVEAGQFKPYELREDHDLAGVVTIDK